MRKGKKIKDKLTIKAKEEGYRARSVYKLMQLNRKYKIIKRNGKVLDLGSYPGGWLQVITKIGAKAVGVDIKKIKDVKNATIIQGDVFNKATIEKIKRHGRYDAVISDLAPNTTGIKDVDQENSYILAEQALNISRDVLKENGKFMCKIFQGEGTDTLIENIKRDFRFVKASKPKASKKRSMEIYIVAIGFKSRQTR